MLALRELLLRVMLQQVDDAVWPSATPAEAGSSIANNANAAARLKTRACLGRGTLVSIGILPRHRAHDGPMGQMPYYPKCACTVLNG